MMVRLLASFALLTLSLVCQVTAADRPNVLIVMVDDLGFSDIGCYGSEIETPNLDRLAAGGLRFSQFYNTAKCHSSRISLLTGQYAFQAGNTKLTNGVTSAEVLRQAGYFTAMTGKWHLDRQPTDFGFDRYFGHLSGACNYFSGDNTFRLNGQPWSVPDSGFYTTVADVDYAIDFLGQARQTEQPWYLYVAFNAPHAPLQALEEDYQKYAGRYDVGWDKIRSQRIAKQKKLQLFSDDFVASERPDHIPAWDSLSEQRRAWESRRMTTLAAMIDRVDQELGRLIENLKQADELKETFILFVSDNGACPYDRNSNQLDAEPTNASVRWSDSTGWAWARNGPFRFYKQNQYEGGISTPAIVHWPAGLKTEPGSIVDQPAHLVDVLPTLAEICDAPIPTAWPDRELRPVAGTSLAPVLAGQELTSRTPIHLLFSRDRGLRIGDWKAVSFRSEPWELYNLRNDRAETKDLSLEHPDRLHSMVQQWTDMAESVLHAPAGAYAPVSTGQKPHRHPEWTDFSAEPTAGNGKKASAKTRASEAPRKSIRARKNTSLQIVGNELRLTCSGSDSGIAMERIGASLARGPYQLHFRVKSTANGDSELYFTVDAKTKLPAGRHQEFDVPHDGKWHELQLPLKTEEQLFALRLDIGSGPGDVTIADLRLTDATGKEVIRWPSRPAK
jgi:arylsulfatase